MSFLQLISIFLGSIVVCALIYYALTFFGMGLVYTFDEKSKPELVDCLYFSVVTITSLGYGDIRPTSLSKILSCIQVIWGLSLLAMAVAKLSSAKHDYLIRRLYSSDVQKRLAEYYESLSSLNSEYQELISQVTPKSESDIDERLRGKFRSTHSIFDETWAVVTGLEKYIRFEVKYGEFFSDVPIRSILRSLNIVNKILASFRDVWNKYGDTTRQSIINKHNRFRIRQIAENANQLANLVKKDSINEKLQEECDSLSELCDQLKSVVM